MCYHDRKNCIVNLVFSITIHAGGKIYSWFYKSVYNTDIFIALVKLIGWDLSKDIKQSNGA